MLLISGAAFIISLFSKGKNTETKESHKDTQTEIKEPHKETEQHQKPRRKERGKYIKISLKIHIKQSLWTCVKNYPYHLQSSLYFL